MSPPSETVGTLWIVATPIGTLGDLSARAREVLESVEAVLAEDTRRARALLSHAGVSGGRRVKSLHEHNEERLVPGLIETLTSGRSLALISDAGTPVLSDPGFRLVRAARLENLPVRSVPGASAFTAALAASGQPPLPATLCGFLPQRAGARRRRVSELAAIPWTLVVLLSPHRIRDELRDLATGLGGERAATLLAEISKRYERAVIATLGELADTEESRAPRGEYVVVVGPAQPVGRTTPISRAEVHALYDDAVAEGLERADALRQVASRLGLRRREVFDLLKGDSGESFRPSDA